KATELWSSLIIRKFLIILDNLWNQWGDEDFKYICIPLVSNDKGSKAILRTREQKVWKYIRYEHMVQLDVMDEDEEWNLFNMNENLDGDSPKIIEVAMEVAKECGGLPLAIVPLARALRGKIINRWKLACHKISSSRLMNIKDVPKQIEKSTYMSLEMSYNNLGKQKTPIGINFKKSNIIEFLASKDRIPSKSSSATFNEIIEALKDCKVKKIGVWGMGGVGKTTLVKEVNMKWNDLTEL
ncbi:hypothetical protein Goshw_008550, partial [Gossypium schwendimanii]|nr:hypothetical protein [Gossypium schwendimanii]